MRRNTARKLAAGLAVATGLLMAVPAIGATGPGSITLTNPTNNQALRHHVEIDWVWKGGTYVKSWSRVNVDVSTNGFLWAPIARNLGIRAGGLLWDSTVWPDSAYAIRVSVVGTTIKSIRSPVFVDNTGPLAEITSPTQGYAVVDDQAIAYPNLIAGTATVTARATDNLTGVSKFEWFIDTVDEAGKIGEAEAVKTAQGASGSLTYDFGTNPGQHTLLVRAIDAAGNPTPADRVPSVEIVAVPGPSTLGSGQPPVPSPDPSNVPNPVPSDSPNPVPSDVPNPVPSDVPSDVPNPAPSETPDPGALPIPTLP